MAAPFRARDSPNAPFARVDIASLVLLALLVLLLACALGGPLMAVAAQVFRPPALPTPDAMPSSFSWAATANTLLFCTAISMLATLLAIPAGWCLRRPSPVRASVLCVPLLLPPYIAYSGWGVLRGAGTWLGDALARGDPDFSLVVGRAFAVFGLALWAYPIAAISICFAARRVPDALLDAMRLEPASRLRLAREVLTLLAPGIALGAAAVALVMIGSAVPLHLAQVQTLAIHLWKYMSLTPEPVRAWLGGWPLITLACSGAAFMVRLLERVGDAPLESVHDAHPPSLLSRVLAGVVWAAAVLAPVALNLWTLRDWSLIPAFWRVSSHALFNSLQTGVIVGLVGAFICIAVWRLAAERSTALRVAARGATAVLITTALIPGVLIGAASVAMTALPVFPDRLVNTNAALVCVHIARFGVLGALVGMWLAARESADERATRELFAPGFRGWVESELARAWSAPVGVALATAALSVHEIEATVLVAPPGPGNLAQRLLDLLHYARDEQLAAASVNITAFSLLAALTAAVLIARAGSTRTAETKNR